MVPCSTDLLMVVRIHLPSLKCSVVIVWHEIWDWCCGHGRMMLPIGQLSLTCFLFEICYHRSLPCVYRACVAHCVQLWLHGVRPKGAGMGPWNCFVLR